MEKPLKEIWPSGLREFLGFVWLAASLVLWADVHPYVVSFQMLDVADRTYWVAVLTLGLGAFTFGAVGYQIYLARKDISFTILNYNEAHRKANLRLYGVPIDYPLAAGADKKVMTVNITLYNDGDRPAKGFSIYLAAPGLLSRDHRNIWPNALLAYDTSLFGDLTFFHLKFPDITIFPKEFEELPYLTFEYSALSAGTFRPHFFWRIAYEDLDEEHNFEEYYALQPFPKPELQKPIRMGTAPYFLATVKRATTP